MPANTASQSRKPSPSVRPAAKSATRSAAAKPTANDAIALLKEDHKKVKKLFKQFDRIKDDASDEDKAALVSEICMELTIHTQIEEEIFYPAVRKAVDDDDMLDEALVEHASAKDLIRQLQGMQAADDLYDAKVTVLGEYIEHHVEEEEKEMFRKAKKAGINLQTLGKKLLARKKSLQQEMHH